MNTFAVVEKGGKQYRVEVGYVLKVDRFSAKVGESFEFQKVLYVSKPGSFMCGGNVVANVLSVAKTQKVLCYKKKRRKGYKKSIGYRHSVVELRISEIY